MVSTRSFSSLVIVGMFCALALPACTKKMGGKQRAGGDRYTATRDQVELKVLKMDADDSHKYFGKNLISKGYQPLSLTIYNDSDDALLLRASSIDLPLETADTVASTAHIPTIALTLIPAYFAGVFFWPALIPVAAAGFFMAASNHTLDNKVGSSALEADHAVEILPYERVTRTIFVANDTSIDEFSLYIFNVHKKSFIPFTIDFRE
jgi:hypothetical protein